MKCTLATVPSLLVLLAFVTNGLATKFEDCGSTSGTVTSLQISGCDSGDTCKLKRGTDASITIAFTPKVKSSSAKVEVQGIIEHIPFPFSFPKPNACEDSGLLCPLVQGKAYTYTSKLPVKSEYPAVSVDVKFQLVDESNNDLVCLLIPSQLV